MNLIQICLLLTSITWIVLSEIDVIPKKLKQQTIQKLRKTQQSIKRFEENHGRLPKHIGEVRAYLLKRGINYTPYDSYGQRLQYIRLSSKDYFLKSFGPKSQDSENNLTVINISKTKKPYEYNFKGSTPLSIFPPIALTGLKERKGNYYGRVIPGHRGVGRFLVILSKNDSNYISTAFHDHINEFLWLHNSRIIVFTASGSNRYNDGIYLWNIESNKIINLLDLALRQRIIEKSPKYYITLSSTDASNSIYFYIQKAQSAALDPAEFFQYRNLIKATIDGSSIRMESYKTGPRLFDFKKISHFDRLILPKSKEHQSVLSWTDLVVSGPIEQTIDQWQNYCASQSDSPVFPYCLWWLASLYGSSINAVPSDDTTTQHGLRSLGIEVSGLLDEQFNAPEYLRAMAYYLQLQFEQKKPISYNVGTLTP